MSIKKYTNEELKKLDNKMDYDRIKNMSEEEIEKNSRTDEDSISPSDEELKKFNKVKNNGKTTVR